MRCKGGLEPKVCDVRISFGSDVPVGLVLRNQQLVTVAVVLLSFLTWAALRKAHGDVASSGRRLEEAVLDEGIQLQSCLLYTSDAADE